jgi:hypothetical protein
VGEEDRLGPLQVGVAGQVGLTGSGRPRQEDLLQVEHPAGDGEQLPLGVEAQVGGDLVVTAAAGVQAGADVAGDLGHPALHRRVDVLVARGEGEAARRELLAHSRQGSEEDLAVGGPEQADPYQPPHVGGRAGQVVGGEAPVDAQAHGVGEQLLGRTGPLEAPLPEGHDPLGSAGARPTLTCRAAHVATPRPHRRTNPSASWWRKRSADS